MTRPDSGWPCNRPILSRAVWVFGAVIFLAGATPASAGPSLYPRMAPIGQYRIADRAKEIAFARSAAPPSVSGHARVLVLGEHGYQTAVAGDNGFVCLVVRSWDKPFGHPEFWNPRIRSPECFNPPGAVSMLPRYLERTRWVLAGESVTQMSARVRAQSAAGKLIHPAAGSFCFMMSKDGYTDDRAAGPWYPHMMFFEDTTPPAQWAANLPDTPLVADSSSYPGITFFLVLVPQWSNGSWIDHK
ncbi:MAG TPA: hypothetical protein VGR92_07135 [Steroidobacteraceae bacterium]|nr:hypothetical protein [Steroidobacteraceae bacterium]